MTSYSYYRKSVTTIGGMALALFLSSQASAQTYNGTLTIGDHSSTYSITTDGTIGLLTGSNITFWGATMSSSSGVTSFNSVFGSTSLFGSSLSATATDLLFDYDLAGVSYLQFCSFNCSHFLYFENNGSSDVHAMRMSSGAMVTAAGQTGAQSIASVPGAIGAVPEPGTWAMMLLGFGGIGVALRRRRTSTAIAQIG